METSEPIPAAAVYADGGVIRINPSPFGGTWAACHVAMDGTHVWEDAGVILPEEVGGPVTNNQTEFYAMLAGLEALPADWCGAILSDSHVTLIRFCNEAPLRGIPEAWQSRMKEVLLRLGRLTPVQLDGHPTKAQLTSGYGKRGNRVSRHNVWCDLRCQVVGKDYMRERAGQS